MSLPGSLNEIPGIETAKVRRKSDVAYDAGHRRSNPVVGVDGKPPGKRRRSHPSEAKSPSAGTRFRARISTRPKVVLSQGSVAEENVLKVVL